MGILIKVPGAKSSLGLPATVTRPFFDGCLNCRWLPRVATRNHLSLSKILSTSQTFIAQETHSHLANNLLANNRSMADRRMLWPFRPFAMVPVTIQLAEDTP